jgi:thioredoxin-dependent adenylylsulfate APS reductase
MDTELPDPPSGIPFEIRSFESRDGRADEARAAEDWARRFESAPPERLLAWASDRWGDRLALVTSFQASGMVLLDLAHRHRVPLRVLTLDTGRLPEETYALIDRVRARYDLAVEVVLPDHHEVEALVREGGPNIFLQSPEHRHRCCFVRKVAPFRRAVTGLEAWISGVRRDEGGARTAVPKVEVDLVNRPAGGLLKLNPLADWSEDQVWSYLHDHSVPYHPLYDRGYRSIGCAPCTRPARPAEDPRASRWWWEGDTHKECGLHLSLVAPPRRQVAGARP